MSKHSMRISFEIISTVQVGLMRLELCEALRVDKMKSFFLVQYFKLLATETATIPRRTNLQHANYCYYQPRVSGIDINKSKGQGGEAHPRGTNEIKTENNKERNNTGAEGGLGRYVEMGVIFER